MVKEGYKGIKYETYLVRETIPDDPRLEDLKQWCKVFHNNNLAPPYEGGSYGNLSFRVSPGKDEFIITCSKSSLADSTENDRFSLVQDIHYGCKRVYYSGAKGRKPSSEAMVHHMIYKKRPKINAIFHGHCNLISDNIENIKIPETAEEKPYGTIELVEEVIKILDKGNFLQMKNHGFLSLGKTIQEAGKLSLEVLARCEDQIRMKPL